jgi:hypothetical protein
VHRQVADYRYSTGHVTGTQQYMRGSCPGHSKDASDLEDVMMASTSKACLSKVKGSSLGPDTCTRGQMCGAASSVYNLVCRLCAATGPCDSGTVRVQSLTVI